MGIERGELTMHGALRTVRKPCGGETSAERERKPRLRLWPNGQFSLSYAFRTEADEATPESEWGFLGGSTRGPERSGLPPNLVSTAKSSQEPKTGSGRVSKKYGLGGITRYGAKMVRSGANLLERLYPLDEIAFVTLTVPAMEREQRVRMAKGWGDAMRQTVQWLTRRLQRAGQAPLVVGVTELQTGRAQRYSQAYLHAHIVIPSRVAGSRTWAIVADDLRSFWGDLIERKAELTLDCNPRIEMKAVKKSAEGYLGKYMTKGMGEMSSIVEDLGEECIPGQHWFMSATLRAMVKKTSVQSFAWGEYLQMILDYCLEKAIDLPGLWHRVVVDVGGREITVAWCGYLSDEVRRVLGLPLLDRSSIITINRDLRGLGTPCLSG